MKVETRFGFKGHLGKEQNGDVIQPKRKLIRLCEPEDDSRLRKPCAKNVTKEASSLETLMLYTQAPDNLKADWWTLQLDAQKRLWALQWIYQHWDKDGADTLDLGRLQLLNFGGSKDQAQLEQLRYDLLAHFVLRLAFATLDSAAEDWFVQQCPRSQESRLLQRRLALLRDQASTKLLLQPHEVKDNTEEFLKVLQIPFVPMAADGNTSIATVAGYALVPEAHIPAIIVEGFRLHIRSSCRLLRERGVELSLAGSKLAALIQYVRDRYRSVPISGALPMIPSESISSANIEEMKASFPPCMRYLYSRLKTQRHLRHWGRLQLWLFLKAGGMTLEDQTSWWRSVWGNTGQFDKEILYNIRHSYGQEGKGTNYSAFNCPKIITGLPRPNAGDFHGCPFSTLDASALKTFLAYEYKLTNPAPLLEYVRKKDFQLACVDLFREVHGTEADSVGNHPNAFFTESIRLRLAQKEAAAQKDNVTQKGNVAG